MKKVLIVLTFALFCSLLRAEERPAAGPAKAAKANNQFAFDLYRQLQSGDGNLFFSPYSIVTAMAMTRRGAGGETALQMDRVLHFGTGLPAGAHLELEKALAPGTVEEGWGDDRKAFATHSLQVANALWAQEKLPVVQAFEDALKKDFGAPLGRIDFRKTEEARKIINDWVAEKTHDRILNIVPEDLPTPDALFAIANAIWFKAAWSHPFEASSTREAPFTTAAGEEVAVPMMHRTGSFALVENERLQMLEIPYRGRETSMFVLLPRAKDGLRSLTASLTADAVKEA
jgi:serpin B